MIILFFIILGIALLVTTGLWILSNWLYDKNFDGFCIFIIVFNVVFDVFLGVIICVTLISVPLYITAENKVNIINKKYYTKYTAKEYFWAGDTIDKIIKTDENLLDSNNKINLDIK